MVSILKDISSLVWLILFYWFAQYASANLNMPSLEMSHITWAQDEQFFLTTKDVFIMVGAILLSIEMYKAATVGKASIAGTVVSFLATVAFIVMFFSWNKEHTVEFFILTIMSILDVIGNLVSISKK